ncbi:hypothetical protein DM058_06515, partial [Klebsiella pneumoniae]
GAGRLHAETALGTGRMTSTFECSKKWGDYLMSRRGECYARHAACGNEKVLIANGEGKRQSKAFLQLR